VPLTSDNCFYRGAFSRKVTNFFVTTHATSRKAPRGSGRED
jgi:hypothetical protein